MQQIRQALKRKHAQLAKLSREIELLQQVEEKLQEIAPLLAEADEEDGSLLVEVEDDVTASASSAKTASASASGAVGETHSEAGKPVALRWP
jgi:prefoldin subunit 5